MSSILLMMLGCLAIVRRRRAKRRCAMVDEGSGSLPSVEAMAKVVKVTVVEQDQYKHGTNWR